MGPRPEKEATWLLLSVMPFQIAPEVSSFAQEMEGKVIVRKVDIDKSPVIAQQLRIQSVPTFMVFLKGRPVDAVVGALGKKKLR